MFLPLSAWMPDAAFESWGWRIPFMLSAFVVLAGYIIRRNVDETPAFKEEESHGEVPPAPIVQAIRESGPDMLRVVCMALMNVVPVTTTVFGAAYATQKGYGIGFSSAYILGLADARERLACRERRIGDVGTGRGVHAANLSK